MILLSRPPASTTLGFVVFKGEDGLGETVGISSSAGLVMVDAVGTNVGIFEVSNCGEELIVRRAVDMGDGTGNLNVTEEAFARISLT